MSSCIVTSNNCTDTDSPDRGSSASAYLVKGDVTLDGTSYTDYCENPTTLHEYYCALVSSPSGKYYEVGRSLPTCNCVDGTCVPTPSSGGVGGGEGSITPTNQTCPICSSPSAWSNCINNNQIRTNYRCGASTNYQCQAYTETQACVSVPMNLTCSMDSECANKLSCLSNETPRCVTNTCQCGAKPVDKTVLLGILIQTETLKTSFMSLKSSAAGLLDYYTSINDTPNIGIWTNVTVLFDDAISNVNDIKTYINAVKDAPTQADITIIKNKIGDVLAIVDKIVEAILSG